MALTSFSSCSYCWIYVELIILSLWHWSNQILVKFVFHAIPKLDWSNFPKFYLLQGRYLLWRLIILATSNQGCNMLKPSVCPHPDQHRLCHLLNFNDIQFAICALLLPWQLLSFIMIINIHFISYSPNYSLRTFLPCIAHIIFQITMINIPNDIHDNHYFC